MIEHKLVSFRMDVGKQDPIEAKLDAFSIEGWQVVTCARTDLYLTVIMTRAAQVQKCVVDDPRGAFKRVFDSVTQAKGRTP